MSVGLEENPKKVKHNPGHNLPAGAANVKGGKGAAVVEALGQAHITDLGVAWGWGWLVGLGWVWMVSREGLKCQMEGWDPFKGLEVTGV